MSTTSAPRKGSDWLPTWDPEDQATWDSGRAWKTLWVTTFSLTLAFITWFLASAIAPKLNSIGFDLSSSQLYWLVAMPGLAGGTLRLVWTFLPPIIGTRKLVTYTTALFVFPLIGWGLAVQNPDTPFAVLLVLGALAGLGGGAFSGFMPSTSYFFPRSKQGTALGVQAGIGNFGVSIVQFVTPWVIGFATPRRNGSDAAPTRTPGRPRRSGSRTPPTSGSRSSSSASSWHGSSCAACPCRPVACGSRWTSSATRTPG